MMVNLHGLTPEKEKTILVAVLGIIALGVLVWFSQDFPAQGQAYSLGFEIEQAKSLNRDLLTYCDTPSACALVDSFASFEMGWELNGEEVSVYELTFFDSMGTQAGLTDSIAVEKIGPIQTFGKLDIRTVGFQGKRFPISSLSTTVLN